MENVSNVSSEDELLQLRNEGKITAGEYEDLLATMRKSVSDEPDIPLPQTEKSRSKRILGIIALVLMLVGVSLLAHRLLVITASHKNTGAQSVSSPMATTEGPAQSTVVRNYRVGMGPRDVLVVAAFELAAFVIGLLAWPDVFGKATVTTISCVITISCILALLSLFAR